MSISYAEVIGDPVAHSKSPLIHNFWLAKLGIHAEYRACPVRSDNLADYFARRRADPEWRGCNVTMPHKRTVAMLVNDVDRVAEEVDAVNAVVPRASALRGINTDVAGFVEPIGDIRITGRHAAVIGIGGAARAVVFALARARVGRVSLYSRNDYAAIRMLADFGLIGDALPIGSRLLPVALLVNATPLGMTDQPPLSVDLSPLPEEAVVYDLVYEPVRTELLLSAQARGLRAIDGLQMLVGQASASFELFFSQPAPREHDAELRALLIA